MPATIQQDITLCINATGCHFTGPLALRRSLSTVLPILYLCCLVCQQVDSQIHYIYYIFNLLLLFTVNISCTAVYLLLFTPFLWQSFISIFSFFYGNMYWQGRLFEIIYISMFIGAPVSVPVNVIYIIFLGIGGVRIG